MSPVSTPLGSADPGQRVPAADGRPYEKSWTDAGLIRSGGTLAFRLAEQPNTRWATDPAGLPQ
ncbi:hypothetical protein [Streptomyces luteolifulvus]|uniref:hypothetical protein n=1 Tax=Streptomyces luteolifulvus TaxID=2615112 RepID=UPI001CD9287A|nr:hypothetical protein [Streptomyces luteolifulvus]